MQGARKSENRLCYKDILVDEESHAVSVGESPITLTLKEYELLKLFVLNAGKVLTRDKLLDSVWGENYGETRTLDIHVGQLRKAISLSEASVETVRGVGYMLK